MTWLNHIGILEYHAGMLADLDRIDRYREAIAEVVRPGDVVVDIGTGTGLLSYFACQAGAARVYAIEEGPVVNLAREMAALNGFDDRVEFFNDLSYAVELPERADVLITETLWNFGIGEGMIGFLADARERFLKPDARIIPGAVDLYIAPLQSDKQYGLLRERPADRHGLDFAPLRHYQVNNVQMPHLEPEGFLAEPVLLMRTELDAAASADFGAGVTISVTKAGVLHGTCGWFRSRLSPSIVLGNDPPAKDSSWAHAFFPVQDAVDVQLGDSISLHIGTAANGSVWRWRTTVARGDDVIATFDQTSFFGFPLDHRAQQRRSADARPKASLHGEVVAYVLHAMDGERTVGEIEGDVRERFGARFPRAEDAVKIVREAAETLGE